MKEKVGYNIYINVKLINNITIYNYILLYKGKLIF